MAERLTIQEQRLAQGLGALFTLRQAARLLGGSDLRANEDWILIHVTARRVPGRRVSVYLWADVVAALPTTNGPEPHEPSIELLWEEW